MSKNFMSEETIRRIGKLVAEGKTNREIALEVGHHESSVGYQAAKVRRGGVCRPKVGAKASRCPDCGGKLPDVRNMAFCPFCGADVATEAQKTARDLSKMLGDISRFYPAEKRDFAIQTINKAIGILKEER